MKEEIINEIERIKHNSDYTNRTELKGFGFSIVSFIKQFYEVGTEKYNEAYNFMFKELEKIYKKAQENTFKYEVEIEYKGLKSSVFGAFETFEERSEEEVLKRVKEEKKFYNLNTERKIKNPIFLKIEVKKIK